MEMTSQNTEAELSYTYLHTFAGKASMNCKPGVWSLLVSALNEIISIKSGLKVLLDRSGETVRGYYSSSNKRCADCNR